MTAVPDNCSATVRSDLAVPEGCLNYAPTGPYIRPGGIMSARAYLSTDGRGDAFVVDPARRFSALRLDGVWKRNPGIIDSELGDDFKLVRDPAVVDSLIAEAQSLLSQDAPGGVSRLTKP